METRQLVLYGLLGVIVLFFGGEKLKTSLIDEPFDAQQKRIEKLEKDRTKAKKTLNRAKKTSHRIAEWEEQSLPADPSTARTVYQEWLVDVVDRSRLTTPSFDSGTPVLRNGIYHSLTFSVRARGTLEQFTAFLYEFYRADFLHQIQSIGITPLRSAGLLDLSISIEAIAMTNSANAQDLPKAIVEEFADKDITYFSPIVRRNIFGIGGEADPANFTRLTAVTEQGDTEAWFTLGSENRVIKLKQGEMLDVGQFTGTVAEIHPTDVILEARGERWLLSIGENLNEASALPPEF